MDITTGISHSGNGVTTGILVHLGHQPLRHGRHDRYLDRRWHDVITDIWVNSDPINDMIKTI